MVPASQKENTLPPYPSYPPTFPGSTHACFLGTLEQLSAFRSDRYSMYTWRMSVLLAIRQRYHTRHRVVIQTRRGSIKFLNLSRSSAGFSRLRGPLYCIINISYFTSFTQFIPTSKPERYGVSKVSCYTCKRTRSRIRVAQPDRSVRDLCLLLSSCPTPSDISPAISRGQAT